MEQAPQLNKDLKLVRLRNEIRVIWSHANSGDGRYVLESYFKANSPEHLKWHILRIGDTPCKV